MRQEAAVRWLIEQKVDVNAASGKGDNRAGWTAMIEAAGLLADGAPAVLVVCYDAPLPQAYAHFHDEEPCEFAWAWLVGPAQSDVVDAGVRVRLQVDACELVPGSECEGNWPAGLAVLRQFLRQVGGRVNAAEPASS